MLEKKVGDVPAGRLLSIGKVLNMECRRMFRGPLHATYQLAKPKENLYGHRVSYLPPGAVEARFDADLCKNSAWQ